MTQTELKELLHYNPDTGIFIWKKKTSKKTIVGKVAGSVYKQSNGGAYLGITINKKRYLQHRLAWLYMTGEMPNVIDHINHNGLDNRFFNLRNITHKDNFRNQRKNCKNTSGAQGVYWRKQSSRWFARIKVDGKNISLGTFSEFSDAVNARKNAEVLYGFHENHGKEI